MWAARYTIAKQKPQYDQSQKETDVCSSAARIPDPLHAFVWLRVCVGVAGEIHSHTGAIT